jgi:hypothetical protein
MDRGYPKTIETINILKSEKTRRCICESGEGKEDIITVYDVL